MNAQQNRIDSLLDTLKSELTTLANSGMSEEQVSAIVDSKIMEFRKSMKLTSRIQSAVEEALAAINLPKKIEVVTLKGVTVPVGTQHRNFEKLLRKVMAGHPVWLVGPAGTGKSYACKKVSDALNLPYGELSVGIESGKHEVFGYMDAHGNYVTTEFRDRWENGGVFLFDEIDACSANVLTSINAALAKSAGDRIAFPDGMVARHPDFRAVAAANTYGNGASREYVGRMQQDAATLDRFMFQAWPYDTDLERSICRDTAWLNMCHAVRTACDAKGIRHTVGRAIYQGADLLAVGEDIEEVISSCLIKGMSDKDVAQLGDLLSPAAYLN